MLKVIFSMLVAITFLILIPPDAFAEAYWGNLKVDIERSVRISGPNSDIIMIEAEFTNNDDEQISIYYDYVRLDDSKNREFSHSVYWTLEDKGHDVTERECPFDWYIDLNPGISEDARFCFEVPKENLTFIFHIYESYLDWCKNPSFGSCQEKTIRLSIRAPDPTPSPPSSSSGSNVQIPQITSRGDIAIPQGTSVPGCEETRSCYIPYRLDVGVGSTVTWHNVDSIAHTVTSGTAGNGPDGSFDSGVMSSNALYSVEFTRDNVFNYFCMLHPWMTGQVNVQRSGTIIGEPASAIPKDTTPPKMLKPADIETDAENQNGAKATFEVLAIDDTDQTIRPVCNPSSGSLFSIGETIVTCNAMDSAGNRASPISFTVTVNPPETTIPSWVKNIASFWCAGSIDDDSFIEGIQYLIDNNIIVVSAIQSGQNNSQGIPEWIKNTACWWSEGNISDSDFASGIQFLIQSGIIVIGGSESGVTSICDESKFGSNFLLGTISTDKEYYEIGDNVKIRINDPDLDDSPISLNHFSLDLVTIRINNQHNVNLNQMNPGLDNFEEVGTEAGIFQNVIEIVQNTGSYEIKDGDVLELEYCDLQVPINSNPLVTKTIFVKEASQETVSNPSTDYTEPKSTQQTGLSYPKITKRIDGDEALQIAKQLEKFSNSLSKSQQKELAFRSVGASDFVIVVTAKDWTLAYLEYDFEVQEFEGSGWSIIPFDCSHNLEYVYSIGATKVDETGSVFVWLFKNGVKIGYETSEKPYGTAIVAGQCDEPYL